MQHHQGRAIVAWSASARSSIRPLSFVQQTMSAPSRPKPFNTVSSVVASLSTPGATMVSRSLTSNTSTTTGATHNTIHDIAQELKEHCAFMMQVLEAEKVDNWWGLQHCLEHVEEKQFEAASSSLLSMYGGMGSFSDYWCQATDKATVQKFDDSREKAYVLAREMQTRLNSNRKQ